MIKFSLESLELHERCKMGLRKRKFVTYSQERIVNSGSHKTLSEKGRRSGPPDNLKFSSGNM